MLRKSSCGSPGSPPVLALIKRVTFPAWRGSPGSKEVEHVTSFPTRSRGCCLDFFGESIEVKVKHRLPVRKCKLLQPRLRDWYRVYLGLGDVFVTGHAKSNRQLLVGLNRTCSKTYRRVPYDAALPSPYKNTSIGDQISHARLKDDPG